MPNCQFPSVRAIQRLLSRKLKRDRDGRRVRAGSSKMPSPYNHLPRGEGTGECVSASGGVALTKRAEAVCHGLYQCFGANG